MNDGDEHDREREVRDQDLVRSRSFAEGASASTVKLVPVKGSGLSGPFIRRPVMTVLLTLSVIVAGLATYGKLAVNDLPAVDYPVIQVTCSYPGADPTTVHANALSVAAAEAGSAHAADELRSIVRHARIPAERADELWERVMAIIDEFSATPRSGGTVFGIAAGLYPTDYPTLPDREETQ